MSRERQYLTALQIDKGIILLIEPDGSLGYYRQRGLGRLPSNVIQGKIASGELNYNWKAFKELPAHYSISYEDYEVMGRARASFKV